jgi:hypothetical protein
MREGVMKVLGWIIAIAGIGFVLPAQAQDRTLEPAQSVMEPALPRDAGGAEVVLYRFPGVFDSGHVTATGVATAFHCTNFSGATEIIRIVIRNFNSDVLCNFDFPIPHLGTRTTSTHNTNLYVEDFFLSTGAIGQGTAAIAATSTSIICTAMTIDAGSATPVGIALRGIRFNPAPGSQE